MKITAVSRGEGNLTPQGLHLAVVTEVLQTVSKTGSKQLEVKFTAEDGSIRKRWFNLVGYKKNRNGAYVDKNGKSINLEGLVGEALTKACNKRIIDDANTAKAMEMIGNFATDLGFTADEEVDTDDFVGRDCIIFVNGNDTQGSIDATFPTERIEYAEKYASEKLGYEVELAGEEV